MKKLIVPFMFAMIIGVGMASLSFAADMAAPSTQTVKGDLLKIDGEFYVVKDTAGKEVRLHVDKTSQLDGTFKAGTRSRPKPRIRAMHRPLSKPRRRCRFGDTNGEVQAQRLGQSSRLAQSIPRRLRNNHFGTAELRWSASLPATNSVERDKMRGPPQDAQSA